MPFVPEFLSLSPNEALYLKRLQERFAEPPEPRVNSTGNAPGLTSCRSVQFDAGPDVDKSLVIGGEVRRRRTDIVCLGALVLALAALVCIAFYSARHGDRRRLFYGYDFLGEICGVGNMTDKPMLFWCKDSFDDTGAHLDLARPMCRQSCPSSSDTSLHCFVGSEKGPREIIDDTESFKVEITYNFQEVQDYSSYAFMGRYCLPRERSLAKQVVGWFRQSYSTRMLLKIDSLRNSWPLLLVAMSLASALGFVNLFLLFRFAGVVVLGSMAIICSMPIAFGAIILYDTRFDSAFDRVLSTGFPSWDVALGVGSILIGALFILACCCLRRAIQTAIVVVRATSGCLMDLPSVFIQPILTILFQIVMIAGMLYGLLDLISCGKIVPMKLEEYAIYSFFHLPDVKGVFRSFTYDSEEYAFIAFYAFMMIWACEICYAFSHFVVAHAVQRWYFTPYQDGAKQDVDRFPLVRSYRLGVSYHLGSLALGSFLIAATRLVRLALGFLARQAQSNGNKVGQAAAGCCMCAVFGVERGVGCLNKHAYMDIAVNATSFCRGARNATDIILRNFPEMGALDSACWIIHVTGVGSISGLSAFLVHVALAHVELFSSPESHWYVQDPLPVLAVSAILCAAVGHAFGLVFDMVAETVLYCRCQEDEKRRQGVLEPFAQYAPGSLEELVGKDSS